MMQSNYYTQRAKTESQATGESYCRILQRLLLSQKKCPVLAVIGMQGGVGRTAIAMALAWEVSRRHQRVLVIDAATRYINQRGHSLLLSIGAGNHFEVLKQLGGIDSLPDGTTMFSEDLVKDLDARKIRYDLIIIDAARDLFVQWTAAAVADFTLALCDDLKPFSQNALIFDELRSRKSCEWAVAFTRQDFRRRLWRRKRTVLENLGIPLVSARGLGERRAYQQMTHDNRPLGAIASGVTLAEFRALESEVYRGLWRAYEKQKNQPRCARDKCLLSMNDLKALARNARHLLDAMGDPLAD